MLFHCVAVNEEHGVIGSGVSGSANVSWGWVSGAVTRTLGHSEAKGSRAPSVAELPLLSRVLPGASSPGTSSGRLLLAHGDRDTAEEHEVQDGGERGLFHDATLLCVLLQTPIKVFCASAAPSLVSFQRSLSGWFWGQQTLAMGNEPLRALQVPGCARCLQVLHQKSGTCLLSSFSFVYFIGKLGSYLCCFCPKQTRPVKAPLRWYHPKQLWGFCGADFKIHKGRTERTWEPLKRHPPCLLGAALPRRRVLLCSCHHRVPIALHLLIKQLISLPLLPRVCWSILFGFPC